MLKFIVDNLPLLLSFLALFIAINRNTRQENYEKFWDPISLSITNSKAKNGDFVINAQCSTGMFRSIRILYYQDGVLYNDTSASLNGKVDVHGGTSAEVSIALDNYTGKHGVLAPSSKAFEQYGESLYFTSYVLAEGMAGDYELVAITFESKDGQTDIRQYRMIDTIGYMAKTDVNISEYEKMLFKDFHELNSIVGDVLKKR